MKAKTCIKLTLIGLLLTASASAQEAQKAIAKVHYIFTHMNDSTQREKFLRDEVVTYLGSSGSYYTSYSKTRASEEIEKQMKDPAFDGNLTITRNTSGIPESYLFEGEKLSEVATVAGDNFVLEEESPVLDWSIGEETKTIGGYNCQQATATFKGRAYIAWFTSELPFSAGPWKLRGLPGLIVEVGDAKKEVQWAYSGFDKLENSAIAIAAPENAKQTNRKEINKLQEAFKANPQAYMEAKGRIITSGVPATSAGGSARATISVQGSASAGGGGSAPTMDASRIKSVNIKNADNYSPSRTTNNPIELIP